MSRSYFDVIPKDMLILMCENLSLNGLLVMCFSSNSGEKYCNNPNDQFLG